MSGERMRVEEVVKLLNEVLPLQARSAWLFTWAAGAATGLDSQVLAQKFEQFAHSELDDARKLVEKIVALGGQPNTDAATFDPIPATTSGVRTIVELENEALAALHRVIPETGQEPRSEAMEHLVEHILLRKQEQIDFLDRISQRQGREAL